MRLAVDRRGSGPLVVLLHGFPLDRSLWSAQLESLSDRYTLVTPDLRGHGQSPAPPGPYSMEALAQDVLETLDAEGLTDPFALGGLSMGGYVALALAEAARDRLRGLLLVNTRCNADTPEAAAQRLATAAAIEQGGGLDALVDAMIPRLFSPRTTERDPALVAHWIRKMKNTPPAGVAGSLRGMASRPDRSGVLAALDLPVLVLAGADDVIVPESEAQTMASLARRGQSIVLPEVGHLAPVEAPEATTQAIRSFLDQLP